MILLPLDLIDANGGYPIQAPVLQAPLDNVLDRAVDLMAATLALDCVHKEYPNKIAHVLNSPADVKAPHELTPAFYGCMDWHSAVHGPRPERPPPDCRNKRQSGTRARSRG